MNVRARSGARSFCATRTRKPAQEGKMLCFCGLRTRTFETQEVENLAARSYECYVRDLTWQNVNNRFNRV